MLKLRISVVACFVASLMVTGVYGHGKCDCRKKNKNSTRFIAKKGEVDEDNIPSASDLPRAIIAGLGDLPPNAKPGECYVRVKNPAKYKTVDERVLIQPETVRYETVPAVFREVEKKVLIKPEFVRHEFIPAKFEKKMIAVELQPEHSKLTAVAAKFKTEEKKFESKPAREYWTVGADPLNPDPKMTKDILCLVQDPAEFIKYTQKVLQTAARVDQAKVAKREQMVETEVLVKPAEVKKITVPAEYKVVKVMELVTPARKQEIPVEAVYKTVKRKVLIAPEKLTWERVLCKTNITPEVIKSIQNALKKKGFDPGAVNGELNNATNNSIKKYQKENKLLEAGLSFEFLEHIGVKPPSKE